jgi:hypothetical protein
MTRRISLFTLVLSIALATVVLMGVNASVSAAAAKPLIVDDFEAGTITNALGSKTNVFLKAPSKAMVSFRRDTREGKPTTVLMIRYDKKSEGGPNDLGGWCGYYTLLKKVHPAASVMGAAPVEIEEAVYLDASQYSNITFWVKGDKGNENFVLGLADAHWDKIGDSVRSQEIGKYLPAGKITTDWQKAVVPLDEFFVDYSKLSAIVVSFESDCFPEGMGSGKLYIDDIELE